MDKPIDWTRPLRTTDCHDRAVVERINADAARPICIHVPATGYRCDLTRDGYRDEAMSVPLVENAPGDCAPEIVERFVPMTAGDHGLYHFGFTAPFNSRREAVESCSALANVRIARVLIEEPAKEARAA